MEPLTRAALDLGSHSALLLVLDDVGATLVDEVRLVGLGHGLGDGGLLRPDRARAALDTLRELAGLAAAHGVPPADVRAVATSALRRARDAEAFVARARAETGLALRVIDGAEEGRLAWRGTLSDPRLLPRPDATALVVDVGGGSTELVLGAVGASPTPRSLELGAVRLTERFLGVGRHDPTGLPRLVAHVDATLGAHAVPLAEVVIGVAGSATTLAAWHLGLDAWSPDAVHGAVVPRDALRHARERLLPLSPAERRAALPLAPERADWLVAGATVLDRVLAQAGADALVVSVRDLRHGLLLDGRTLADGRGAM